MPQRGAAPSGEHRIGDWLIAGADDWEPRRSRRTDRRRARATSASIDQLWADADFASVYEAPDSTRIDEPHVAGDLEIVAEPGVDAGSAIAGRAPTGAGVATLDPPRTHESPGTRARRAPTTSDAALDAPAGALQAVGPLKAAGSPSNAAVPADGAPADGTPAGVPGRRTVTIRGRGAERYVPTRPAGTRPTRRRYERAGFRPDRAAMWAVLLGVMLILVAVTSAHAAILH